MKRVIPYTEEGTPCTEATVKSSICDLILGSQLGNIPNPTVSIFQYISRTRTLLHHPCLAREEGRTAGVVLGTVESKYSSRWWKIRTNDGWRGYSSNKSNMPNVLAQGKHTLNSHLPVTGIKAFAFRRDQISSWIGRNFWWFHKRGICPNGDENEPCGLNSSEQCVKSHDTFLTHMNHV